jgi:hypothetical protein
MSEKWEYKSPLNKGYKKFKLTKKQHNRIFKYRQKRWHNKFEYYYQDNGWILVHEFDNFISIVFETFLSLTIGIFMLGIPQVCKNLKRSWNQKKYGRFSSEHIRKSDSAYSKIMSIINGCGHCGCCGKWMESGCDEDGWGVCEECLK